MGIKGKLALVVGASKGMGREVALELAREGCRVIGVARSVHPDAYLDGVMTLQLDMTEAGAVQELVKFAGSPDIIYHCMGGSIDGIKDVFSPSADWAKVWQFNLGIAIDLNNAFIPGMVERRWGRIVHTSSDAVTNRIGNVPYTASKFAVEGYVKTASRLFAKNNVIITAVSPGPIHTPGRFIYSQSDEWTQEYFDKYVPAQRFGTAQEVAKVVCFLCGEGASYMPGAIVKVDGGSR